MITIVNSESKTNETLIMHLNSTQIADIHVQLIQHTDNCIIC